MTPTEADERAAPCPFCGHSGLDFAEGSTFRWIVASCAGCGASRGETRIQTLGDGTKEEWMADAKEDAIRDWNTRAALARSPATGEGSGEAEEPLVAAILDGMSYDELRAKAAYLYHLNGNQARTIRELQEEAEAAAPAPSTAQEWQRLAKWFCNHHFGSIDEMQGAYLALKQIEDALPARAISAALKEKAGGGV